MLESADLFLDTMCITLADLKGYKREPVKRQGPEFNDFSLSI